MIILASNSPRRKELLKGLDIEYRTWVIPDIDESYPETLKAEETAEYISRKKSEPYFLEPHVRNISDNDIVLTADTVVILEGRVMGKPADEAEACQMLRDLSGKEHSVITGVCLRSKTKTRTFSVRTAVEFDNLTDEQKRYLQYYINLTDEQINYYVAKYKPLDKAGAYGVQEWIGYVGVKKLVGSYFNVMGLPVQRIYSELASFK